MIFVTGSAGFIGSNFLSEWLSKRKGRVISYDKLTYAGNLLNLDSCLKDSRHTFIKGDICQTDKLLKIFKDFEPSLIVNFAAESHVDRSIDSPHTLKLFHLQKRKGFGYSKFLLMKFMDHYQIKKNPLQKRADINPIVLIQQVRLHLIT